MLQDLSAVAHDTQLVQARLPIEEYDVSVSQMTLYNISFLNRNQDDYNKYTNCIVSIWSHLFVMYITIFTSNQLIIYSSY